MKAFSTLFCVVALVIAAEACDSDNECAEGEVCIDHSPLKIEHTCYKLSPACARALMDCEEQGQVCVYVGDGSTCKNKVT
ncbi:hypothetical protein DdX_09205 [Ditylenchus destructor]|uniref:Uncharacterized protein n=1 Tax=Ditylenchus destructor TaxID=166010 RepID=A0AAD4N272_9BILA|nr:hypothetical protein DdX_09205 [Ditylenchus destructor]